jgi:hypothetical protein
MASSSRMKAHMTMSISEQELLRIKHSIIGAEGRKKWTLKRLLPNCGRGIEIKEA